MKSSDWFTIAVAMEYLALIVFLLFMMGCAYNPYSQPHFDWTGTPALVPIDERRAPDAGKMCLGPVA